MPERSGFTFVLPQRGDPAAWRAGLRSLQQLIDGLEPEEFVFLASHLAKALSRRPRADGKPVAKKRGVVGEASVPYGRAEDVAVEIEVLVRSYRNRRERLRHSMSATEVAALLGTSRQTPHDRAKAGTLLAIRDEGALRFPVWQFDPTGPNGVIDGLPAVLQALRADPYSKLCWLVLPKPGFDGESPLEILKRGQVDLVVRAARGAGVS